MLLLLLLLLCLHLLKLVVIILLLEDGTPPVSFSICERRSERTLEKVARHQQRV